MPMTNSANFEVHVHVTIDKVNMEYVKKAGHTNVTYYA